MSGRPATAGPVISAERRRRMLITALGSDIAAAMRDSQVTEIMVNPDGALRLDRLGEGRIDTEVRIEPDQVERIIRLVASHVRAEVHADHPILSTELPPHIEGRAGERFEGVLPPVSSAPCFSIRKPATRLHTLDDYVAQSDCFKVEHILPDYIISTRNVIVPSQRSCTEADVRTLAKIAMDLFLHSILVAHYF